MIIALIFTLVVFLFLTLVLKFFGVPIVKPKVNVTSKKIKVACVGDSITFGFGVSNWKENNYPHSLNKLLGESYDVANFGDCGRTALKDSSFPYPKSKTYLSSLNYNPEIVIIMLGTNDTRERDWKGKDIFKEQYEELINSYKALNSVKKIYICTPIPAYKNIHQVRPQIIQDEIYSAVKELAQKLNLTLIDTNQAFLNKPKLLMDGVHPNKEGASLLATTIFNSLKNNSN